jgi:hypothetical protein
MNLRRRTSTPVECRHQAALGHPQKAQAMTAKGVDDRQPPADKFASAIEVEGLKLRIAALEATIRVMTDRAMPPIVAEDVVQTAEALYTDRIRARMTPAVADEDMAHAVAAVNSGRFGSLRNIIHFPQITLPASVERAIRRLFE